MRSPLGLKVLLVLILGLVAINPIRAYYYDDPPAQDSNADSIDAESAKLALNNTAPAMLPSGADDRQPSIDQQQQQQRQQSSSQTPVEPSQPTSSLQTSDLASEIESQTDVPQQPPQEQSGSLNIEPPRQEQNQKRNMEEPVVEEADSSEPADKNSGTSGSKSREPAQFVTGDISKPINEPLEGRSSPSMATSGDSGSTKAASSANTPSSARGFTSDIVSAFQKASTGQQKSEASADDLPPPRIIENDRAGSSHQQQHQPQQQMKPVQQQQFQPQPQLQYQPQQPQQARLMTIQQATSGSSPQQTARSQNQQDQEQPQPSQQQPKQQQQSGTQLGQSGALILPGNSSVMSAARTFDSWTGCVGTSSNKYGTCKNDVECNKSKGRADGSCMGGFGVCCVMALTCGDKSIENNTFFANPDFPEPSWEARLCEVEVKKKHSKILQVMIEFEEFELAPPNYEGECTTDVFQVKLASSRPSPYSLLRICGQNTGQHMYLDVSQIEEPLVLSVATSGGGFPRRWSIRIVQMDDKNFLLAPPGCLQYYTDTVGHFRSFNLGRNLKNLYYAICFRIDNGYSGIRFTDNFFGMNGPSCRRRIGGHNKTSTEPHLHHLVIPPQGYAPPSPRPSHLARHPRPGYGSAPTPYGPSIAPLQQPQYQQQPRYKRMAYMESDSAERVTRTFHPVEKDDKKFEEKEGKHQSYPSQPSYGSSGYGPSYSSNYGPPPPRYGPPSGYGPSHPGYGASYHEYNYHPEYNKKHEKYEGKWDGGEQDSKGWGWMWSSKDGKTSLKDEKKGHSHPHSSYGYSESGGYGQSGGYGSPGYSSPGYGDYHYKQIDQLGKKYEVLEYKHEKNHKDKDKDEAWWKVWGKKEQKDDDKKEKFDQHHEAMFPMIHIPEMPHCEPRFCGQNDVITFPPSGDSISEMCGNRFNRGHGPKIISGSPLVVYVSNRGHTRGAGFDMNYEQVFYIPKPY